MANPEQSSTPRVRRSRWKRAILYPSTIIVLIIIVMASLFGHWLRGVFTGKPVQDTPKTEEVRKDERVYSRGGYSLFCHFQSEQGVGLGHISCELRRKTSGEVAGRATSGIAGGMDVEGLSPGSYLLHITSRKTWQTQDGKPIAVEILPTQKTRTKAITVTLIKNSK